MGRGRTLNTNFLTQSSYSAKIWVQSPAEDRQLRVCRAFMLMVHTGSSGETWKDGTWVRGDSEITRTVSFRWIVVPENFSTPAPCSCIPAANIRVTVRFRPQNTETEVWKETRVWPEQGKLFIRVPWEGRLLLDGKVWSAGSEELVLSLYRGLRMDKLMQL